MIEKIFDDLYKLEIPLPRSPLKAVNSYLIRGEDRFLIIDTGMNRETCLKAMRSCLKELEVDLNRTDFFITHLHADHLGLIGHLASDTSTVYFSQAEARVISGNAKSSEERRADIMKFYISSGFPEEELKTAMANHPGYRYSPQRKVDFTRLKEGDGIQIGDYAFTCIDTPGHSPGHMCLYEPQKKLFISGDHILIDITPNITNWAELENSLKSYLTNLKKIYDLEIDLVLPGHRKLITDHQKRIDELQEHHRDRLHEVLEALKEGEKTAWQIAPYITWDIDFRSWEDFPPVQKWFALGETMAHIDYLEAEGKINKRDEAGRILFSLGPGGRS
jgi:glyoxylase-like metal-dependent hydrolase (beta-lactamase superfamily II)